MFNGKLFHHFILAITALLFFLPSINTSYSLAFYTLSLTVLTGTFFIYRLSVWVPIISSKSPYLSFYLKPHYTEFLLYLGVLLSCCYFLNLNTIILFVGWGFLSILYFINLKIGTFELKGLRSIPFIKTLLLALMWTMIGYIFNLKSITISNTTILNFIIRFIIIFLICLGVDLRDINKDQASKTSTLATLLGFKKLKSLMLFGNTLLLLLLIKNYSNNGIDLIISSILFIILLRLKINARPLAFTLLLDGTLFLYSLLNFIASYSRFC